MAKAYNPIPPGVKWFKILVVKIVFFVLGRAFQLAAKLDEDIRKEVASWEEGFSLMMKVRPDGPSMGMEKKDGKLRFRGSKLSNADLTIYIRNVESAFLIMTPQLGAPWAFAQNRLTIKGDLSMAMAFSRCLTLIVCYLYPKFISKHLVKRVPPMTLKKHGIRLLLYCVGIPLGV